MTTLEYARRYLDAGVSVIPVAPDGRKAPDGPALPLGAGGWHTWRPYQQRLPTPAEARRWWAGGARGIAAVCGRVSGGLEVIDFDTHAARTFRAWRRLVAAEHPGLLSRLCVVRTPRRPLGAHVWLRCPAVSTPGNAKLAIDPALPGRERTLIETRGEGGYALVPGCPPACHPGGGQYEVALGVPLWDMRPVSAAERECLVRCARALSREARVDAACARAAHEGGPRPGDLFNRQGPDWQEILGAHGWCVARQAGGVRYWRRPGKDGPGWSASTGHCTGKDGSDLLHVFSSNAQPFEDGRSYCKFRAVCLLEHGGDMAAAARALAARGYGGARPAGPSRRDVATALRVLEAPTPEVVEAARRLVARYGV